MFRRVAVAWVSPGDPTPALSLARRLAPGAERLHLLCLLPPAGQGEGPASWDEWSERAEEVEVALDGWREGAEAWCPAVTAATAIDVGPPSLREAADGAGADLVVLGAFPTRRGRLPSLLRECVRDGGPATAWAGRGGGRTAGPARHFLCPVGGDARDVGSAAAMLRDVLAPADRVTLLWLGDADDVLDGEAPALAAHSGLRAEVAFERLQAPLADLDRAVLRHAGERGADAVALPSSLLSGPPAWLVALLGARVLEEASVPLLLLPAPDGHPRPWGRPALLDAADAFPPRRGEARISVERVGARGQPEELPDGTVWVVPEGAGPRPARVEAGMARFPLAGGDAPGSVALAPAEGRVPAGDSPPPPEAVATLIASDASRVVLVDALLPEDTLARIRRHPGLVPGGEIRRVVAVRSRPGVSFHELRARLVRAGYDPPLLLDAHQVLDDDHLADLPPGVDGVRLARVGAHLRADGVAVEALVHGGAPDLSTSGFACLVPGQVLSSGPEPLRARIDGAFVPPPAGDPADTAARLDALTASRSIPGNRVEVELDNAAARRRLLEVIGGARERVHLQSYIVMDDAAAGQVEGALADAAARGVRVRLLVDSLWSLHGSFGVRNPLLDRLAAFPAVEVRATRPLAGVPSLDELKRRDHRKLAVVDGSLALVTGRNLSAYNYAGFDEVAIGPDTPAQDVPLLDAGAWIGGPAARAVDETFLGAWTAAGGEPFPLPDPPPQGTAAVRIVAHRGMRDAHTLDAYLELVRSARHHLFVVNTFPLHLEVLRALLAAIRRGVRVRALFGNVRPLRGDGVPFPGGAGALRTVATQLVHARMDALVEAGGEACQVVVPAGPGWDPAVREVLPHVHAKVVTCDGGRAAIGSANLDVTAGYWESEAVAIVEDPAVVAALEADLSALAAVGRRVDRDDPAWRALAGRRAWLSSHWPGLIG
ncbi:phosphatidylserine/phosphatidylglycerophosphate/cardiolipin synthase family protein [Myxococcota bacterium]|nr:phosphatidylserine/phosphatidylglycerophosphate/cardiolipin synthase family protein [Myxococcota bacterium]